MRAALGGDEAAYSDFLHRVAAIVRGSARRKLARTGTGIDAEDIVQETLLAIHLKRHTWRPSEPILPWIFAIARYKFIRSEEHTSELQSRENLVCRLLL